MDRSVCKDCGKEFKKVGKLQRHIREIHQNLKPFKCEICQKDFKRNSHLKRHMTCHSENPKPFSCTLDGCTQRFSNKHHLMRHIKIVHDQDRYRCKSCDVSFKKKKFLQKHLADEHASFYGQETVDSTKTPRYNEQPFIYDDPLQKKVKKEEENDFKIEFNLDEENKLLMPMDRNFQDLIDILDGNENEQKENLKANKKGPYKCHYETCDKAFSKLNNLKSHFRAIHLKTRLFKCDKPGCEASFVHKSSLKRHSLTKHVTFSENNATNSGFQNFVDYFEIPQTNIEEFFTIEDDFNRFINDLDSLRYNLPIKHDELNNL